MRPGSRMRAKRGHRGEGGRCARPRCPPAAWPQAGGPPRAVPGHAELQHVIGYTRVSTANQALGDSVEAQAKAVRDRARSRGWEAVGVAADAGKVSARLLDAVDRPGLLDAVGAIERRERGSSRSTGSIDWRGAPLLRRPCWRGCGPRAARSGRRSATGPSSATTPTITIDVRAAGDGRRRPARARLRGRQAPGASGGARPGAAATRAAGSPTASAARGTGRGASLIEIPAEQAVIARIRRASADVG